MTTREENNRHIIRQVFAEAFNHKNMALLDTLFSPLFSDQSTPGQPPGPQGVKAYFAQVHAGFPDMQITIEDLIAEQDRVVARTVWRGTHLGPYDGVEPTGKRVARTMIQIFRLENGKILEEWNEGPDLSTLPGCPKEQP